MTFAKPSIERKENHPEEQSYHCAADGCPLPGSIGGHEGPRYCAHHHGKHTGRFDQISTAIKQNLWMMGCVSRLKRSGDFYGESQGKSLWQVAGRDVYQRIQARGCPELLPGQRVNRHGIEVDEKANINAWAQRISEHFSSSVHKASLGVSKGEYELGKVPHKSVLDEFADRMVA